MVAESMILTEVNGGFILIDNSTCRIFSISRTIYEILQEYKKNCDSSKNTANNTDVLKAKYGEMNVDKALAYINSLGNGLKGSGSNGNGTIGGKETFRSLLTKEPQLVESVFMIADSCTMRCRYCYATDDRMERTNLMSREMAEQYFKLFLQYHWGNGRQKVKFLGGEPLLNFDVIKYLVDLWERVKAQYPSKTIYFGLTTNGTLFTSEIVRYIKANHIGVTISLDGPADLHNHNRRFCDGSATYDSVMRGIEVLEKHDVKYSVRATVTSDGDLDELYHYFRTERFENVNMIPVDFPLVQKRESYQWDISQYKIFTDKNGRLLCEGCENIIHGLNHTLEAKMMNKAYQDFRVRNTSFPFKCSAGWWSAAFGADGYIYPCHRFAGKAGYRIGDSVNGIRTDKIERLFRHMLKASWKCNSCLAYLSCKRRCMYQMTLENGDFSEIPEELCLIYRDAFHHTLELILKIKNNNSEDIE